MSSCDSRTNPKSKRVLLKKWSYSLDNREFVELPEKPLGSLYRKVPGNKGLIYLRSEFDLPMELMISDAGLALGKIEIASKIYINSKPVGETGNFPPNEFSGGQAYTNIRITPDLLRYDEKNEIVILLYVNGTGGISDTPFISTYEDTTLFTNRMTFLYSKLNMIISFCMVFLSICYFMIFTAHKEDTEYRDYALMNFWTAFYLVPMWIAEMPQLSGFFDLLWWKKTFEGLVAFFTAHCASSFIFSFMKVKQSKRMLITRWAILGGAVTYMLLIPNLVIYSKMKFLFYASLMAQLGPAVLVLIRLLRAKKRKILGLLVGFCPVIIFICVDIVIKGIAKLEMVPFMTVYGWQLTSISFMAIVTKRYSVIRKSYEYLNNNLEQEVKERTEELTKANAILEKQNTQAKKDMELAVNVQKSFYPQELNFKGWDVAVNFEPLSGVSGDLYDFYVQEGKLKGFGLFDVSGHGISSGLITMLAKNTIMKKFIETLPLKLSDAILKINSEIIREKGEIENYLTGCLFRMDKKDEGKLEFVNCGGPHPIFKSIKKKSCVLLTPNKDKPQYGMLGVKGLDVNFQTIKQAVKTGDFFVLYTDGLTEAENVKGEAFGKDRLIEAVNAASGSAQEIIDSVMEDFKDFIGPNELEDDISVVVLKKVEENQFEENDDFGKLEVLEAL
ncbi:MAG: SpoIIE family protein phosphatase [Treponema sp.]|nr:SpoIIE family protein phosphatase [Treponema sp.]